VLGIVLTEAVNLGGTAEGSKLFVGSPWGLVLRGEKAATQASRAQSAKIMNFLFWLWKLVFCNAF